VDGWVSRSGFPGGAALREADGPSGAGAVVKAAGPCGRSGQKPLLRPRTPRMRGEHPCRQETSHSPTVSAWLLGVLPAVQGASCWSVEPAEALLPPDSADDRRDGLDDHGPGGKTDGRSASRAMGGGEVVPQLRGLVGAGGRQFTARPLRPGGPAALTTASVLEGLSASRSASPSGNPAAPLPPALHPWKPATR